MVLHTYWNQYRFSKDPELTIEDLKRYHDKDWIWEDVCKNPNLKIDDLYLFKKPFDCFRYVLNPNLNIDFINKHSDEICYCEMSRNPELPIDYVIDNCDKRWSWKYISQNTFENKEIRNLKNQYKIEVLKLAKEFYWNTLNKMCKPPNGYYFKKDIENMLKIDFIHK